MNISKKSWFIFSILAVVAIGLWYKYSFATLSFINSTTTREDAINIASEFLKSQNVDLTDYKTVSVFRINLSANQFLQKNLGINGLRDFVETHDFDMFFWQIRFFKEFEKEEYVLKVSSKTGEILSYHFAIDENRSAENITKTEAKSFALTFLKDFYNFDDSAYTLSDESSEKFDNRQDYTFVWQKNNVAIPWSKANASTAKLKTDIKVTGNKIIAFNKNSFDTPESFKRFITSQKNIGLNLMTIFQIINIALIAIAVFYVVIKRNQLAMSTSKNFYIAITVLIFLLMGASFINQNQHILYQYNTSFPFNSFLMRAIISFAVASIITSVMIIMPSLAGESIYYESASKNKRGSFLYYLQTTFLSRDVAKSILFGYLICICTLGLQALIIHFGELYCGVWVEYSWLNNLSTAFLPFLAAFIIAFQAAVSEELIYRFFTLNWLRNLTKNIIVAVLLSSIIWGFSHSDYPVFPMWFRGLEVTILGIFLGIIYLRFGLITVIVSHFVFDAFWMSAAYLFGESSAFNFYTSLMVCLLPAIFAFCAFIINKRITEQKMTWKLNKHQIYNLEVLIYYLKDHWSQYANLTDQEITKEIVSHGWDMAVVEEALAELKKRLSKSA